jgi:hypothetical protein
MGVISIHFTDDPAHTLMDACAMSIWVRQPIKIKTRLSLGMTEEITDSLM